MTDEVMKEIIRKNREALGFENNLDIDDNILLDSFVTVNRVVDLDIVEQCNTNFECYYILADGLIVGYEKSEE